MAATIIIIIAIIITVVIIFAMIVLYNRIKLSIQIKKFLYDYRYCTIANIIEVKKVHKNSITFYSKEPIDLTSDVRFKFLKMFDKLPRICKN